MENEVNTNATSNKVVNSNSNVLFGNENTNNKLSIIIISAIILISLFLGGYVLTKTGHGPVAGVKGEHEICTVNDVKLTYDKTIDIGKLNDDNITRLSVITKECGNLIIDKDHLSNIDGILYMYQNIDIGKMYEFRIIDGKYINHVNISM